MIKAALRAFLFLTLFVAQLHANAQKNDSSPMKDSTSRPKPLRLSISSDNDLYAPSNSDKDYTAGFAIALQRVGETPPSELLDIPLSHLDNSIHDFGQVISSGFEIGSYGFTPDDIEAAELDRTDRPYASLVYLSANRNYRSTDHLGVWTSTLTLGLLGVDVFESGQRSVHKLVTGDKPRGWNQQISEGGELTARYQLAYHQLLDTSIASHQLKTSYFASLGYLTETGVALSFRRGLISSPDYRFNPAITSYGEQTNASDAGSTAQENYFWGGAGLKVRAYNAFLEGQFRDSAHTFSNSKLRPLIAEVWAGYTLSLFESTKLSYIFRAHSSEIRGGTGDRNLMWGGFVLSLNLP
jgi:hypothetical protein